MPSPRRPTPGLVSALALLLGAAAPVLGEDAVYVFRDGRLEEHRGTLLEERDDGSIRLRTADGKELSIAGRDIANVVRDPRPAVRPEAAPAPAPETAVPETAVAETDVHAAEPTPAQERAPTVVPERTAGRERAPDPGRPPRRSSFLLRAHGGLAEQALDDVNRSLGEDEEAFGAAGADVAFDRFGRTPEFGLGAGVRTGRGFGFGVEGGWQASRVEMAYEDPATSVSTSIALRVLDVLGTLDYALPAGLHVGVAAGVGFGRAVQESRTRDLANPANDEESRSEWTGAGFSGGAFARIELPAGRALAAFVQGGYRHRNLGRFAGETRSSRLGDATTEPVDNDGDAIEFDFSGPYVRAGLAISAGG